MSAAVETEAAAAACRPSTTVGSPALALSVRPPIHCVRLRRTPGPSPTLVCVNVELIRASTIYEDRSYIYSLRTVPRRTKTGLRLDGYCDVRTGTTPGTKSDPPAPAAHTAPSGKSAGARLSDCASSAFERFSLWRFARPPKQRPRARPPARLPARPAALSCGRTQSKCYGRFEISIRSSVVVLVVGRR